MGRSLRHRMAIANDLEDCSCCHLHIWNYHRIKSQARARKDHLEVVKRSLHISSKWLAFVIFCVALAPFWYEHENWASQNWHQCQYGAGDKSGLQLSRPVPALDAQFQHWTPSSSTGRPVLARNPCPESSSSMGRPVLAWCQYGDSIVPVPTLGVPVPALGQ